MARRPRWKLRHLFALMTIASSYFGLASMLDVHPEDAVTLVSLVGLFAAMIFEHRMAQWISLVIAAICVMWLVAWALLPDLQ